MSQRRRRAALATAALALGGLALGAAATPERPAAPPSRVERAAQDTEKVRELRFRRSVPVLRVPAEKAKELLAREIDAQLPEAEAGWRARLLAELELIPRGYPLRDSLLALLTEQAAGFYVASRHQLVVVDLPPGKLPAAQGPVDAVDAVLVHELDHALTDQHFDLVRLLENPLFRDRDDLLVARQALAEGDATLVMMLDAYRRMGAKPVIPPAAAMRQAMRAGGATGQFPQLDSAPPYVRAMLIEPYVLGLEFVARAWQRGGWAAVDREWRSPPSSTEQILHPERRDDVPVPVGLESVPSGWKVLGSMELGELGLRTWLSAHVGAEVAERAAAGWGGDRVALIERPRTTPQPKFARLPDTETAVHFATTWDTRPDADEFAKAAETWLRAAAKPEDNWRIDQANRDVTIFFERAATPEIPVVPLDKDPWERPASTLKNPPEPAHGRDE